MTNQTFIRIAIAFLLLTGLALGGFDLSASMASKNLSMAEFSSLGIEDQSGEAALGSALGATAPQVAATTGGTEVAAYTDQTPSAGQLGKVLPSDFSSNYPMYIYYDGSYIGWNDFSATFPATQPGLWVERAAGWSWYATMPLGGWTRQLLYVPEPSSLTMYELYPEGYAMSYDLGFSQPGYYYIWYYADSPGRHQCVLATSGGFSNMVVIDVYAPMPPSPTPPSPQEQCESNPLCSWANGQCLCRGLNPPEPEPMPEPEPEPAPNPAKESCEKNPSCSWADGRCLCMGFGASSSESEGSGDLLGSEPKESGDLGEIEY